jgi:superfamily II DNA or RNA helicase
MYICVSNKTTVKDATPEAFEWCRKNLEFPNPEYAKKENMGLWTGNIEPIIVLWERKGNDAIIPYGATGAFMSTFNCPLEREKRAEANPESILYDSTIELFDYQEKALEAVHCKYNGVIVMPCGAGKTQTALELVARLGRKTLWITHTQELLRQSYDRAQMCFNLPSDHYGTITAGKINVGKAITFATVQTMANIDLEPYKDYWDVIIVDECHKAVGTPTKLMMFYKVVSALSAPFKFGLTATPERNDGLERCMYALLGGKLCEVPESAVERNKVPTKVWQYESSVYNPNLSKVLRSDGTLDYVSLINDLCQNEDRNKDIAVLVNQMNQQGKSCLVLSDRVEHLEHLRKAVGEDYTDQIYSMGASQKARQARKDCLTKLRDKEIRCLFATYQLAKEGLDIPSLDCVVFATPHKDKITVVQSCGRVGRKAPGKTAGYVIDYVDTAFSIFQNYGRQRRKMYKSKKFEIF